MNKKIMTCPKCQKKVGSLKLISDDAFRCSGCKSIVEIKIINTLEKARLGKLMKTATGILMVLFLGSVVAWFLNVAATDYGFYVFCAEWMVLVFITVLVSYIIGQKKRLYQKNELKLKVSK